MICVDTDGKLHSGGRLKFLPEAKKRLAKECELRLVERIAGEFADGKTLL